MDKKINKKIKEILSSDLTPNDNKRAIRMKSKNRVVSWCWIKYYSVKYSQQYIFFKKSYLNPLWYYLKLISNVLVFSLFILAALYLLFNIQYSWLNFLGAIGLYFIVEEAKGYLMDLVKK